MGVELKELVKQINSSDVKLLAGKEGLSNNVEWIHMVDTVEIAEFLSGGELAFTTGLGVGEQMSIMDLIENLYKKKSSGIFINIGPYIKEIPKEAIDFGNSHNFPIFEVKWKVHMSEIMRMFSFTITSSEQRTMELVAAFKNAIFMPRQEELYISTLMQKGYFAGWNYIIGVIDICDRVVGEDQEEIYSPLLNQRLEMFLKNAELTIKPRKHEVVLFTDQDRIVIVFSDISENEASELVEQARKGMEQYMKDSEVTFAGTGAVASDIRSMSKSYILAHKIAQYCKVMHMYDSTMKYSDMGMYKILLDVADKTVLEEYYNETIKVLDDYDANNGSNLVKTLECYMDNNGSVFETADELFVHRNTVNYKLKKIESLLGISIADYHERNRLALGLCAGITLKL